jgi:DNA-binding response OmpR family regulator
MLTAKGQQTEREKGLEAGADDYFVKPFSPLELIKKVEEYLG